MNILKTIRQCIALPLFFVGGLFMLIAAYLAIDEEDFQR